MAYQLIAQIIKFFKCLIWLRFFMVWIVLGADFTLWCLHSLVLLTWWQGLRLCSNFLQTLLVLHPTQTNEHFIATQRLFRWSLISFPSLACLGLSWLSQIFGMMLLLVRASTLRGGIGFTTRLLLQGLKLLKCSKQALLWFRYFSTYHWDSMDCRVVDLSAQFITRNLHNLVCLSVDELRWGMMQGFKRQTWNHIESFHFGFRLISFELSNVRWVLLRWCSSLRELDDVDVLFKLLYWIVDLAHVVMNDFSLIMKAPEKYLERIWALIHTAKSLKSLRFAAVFRMPEIEKNNALNIKPLL